LDRDLQALGVAGVATRRTFDRRLAAVLIADVAGYSRLMERDETGTHMRLQNLRTDVVKPALARHGGRITRSTGDGLLATFASATEALRCSVEIQREFARRNAQVPQAEQIRLRMGLNIGDVLFDQHDIAGVSVNLAARLEALARPGEICISRALKEQVQDPLDVKFLDAGSRCVKNISRPVRVYRVLPMPLSPRAALHATIAVSVASLARWIAAVTGAVAVAVAAIALMNQLAPRSESLATAAPATVQNAEQLREMPHKRP
jgi:adenylate cyclase